MLKLDVEERGEKKNLENPGAEQLMARLGGENAGLPYCVFLNKDGLKIADSLAMPQAANIGFPSSPEEIQAWEGLMRRTAPDMSVMQIAKISAYFREEAAQANRGPSGRVKSIWKTQITFGIINLAGAFLLVAFSLPLVFRKIQMNRWYGFRIPKAFESVENWYNINSYGARQFIGCSWIMILAGVFCIFYPLDNVNDSTIPLLLGVVPILLVSVIALGKTARYASKL